MKQGDKKDQTEDHWKTPYIQEVAAFVRSEVHFVEDYNVHPGRA